MPYLPFPVARTSAALALKLFCATHLFVSYGFEIHGTFGPSMLPTLNIAGDFCLVDKWNHYQGKDMKVGDLVVASKPGHPDTFILKRIIGMVSLFVTRRSSEF